MKRRDERRLRHDLLNFSVGEEHGQRAGYRGGQRGGGQRRGNAAAPASGRREEAPLCNFRFGVLEGADMLAAVSSPDQLLPWEHVQQVVCWEEFEDYRCPICLETPVVPRATRCGHVFCLGCVLQCHEQHRREKEECAAAGGTPSHGPLCPLCQREISKGALRTVVLFPIRLHGEGDTVHFTLVLRTEHSVLASTPGEEATGLPPPAGCPAAQYSRYYAIAVGDLLDTLGYDERVLRERLREAREEGDAEETAITEQALHMVARQVENARRSSECAEAAPWRPQPPADPRPTFQASDGQHFYLSTLCTRMLMHDAELRAGAQPSAPGFAGLLREIEAPVVEALRVTQDEHSRAKHRAQAALPLGTDFCLAHVDLTGLVSPATFEHFAPELRAWEERRAAERQRQRRQDEQMRRREQLEMERRAREQQAAQLSSDWGAGADAPDGLAMEDETAYPSLGGAARRQPTGAPETRADPADGEPRSRAEFAERYGGDAEWEAAKPAAAQAPRGPELRGAWGARQLQPGHGAAPAPFRVLATGGGQGPPAAPQPQQRAAQPAALDGLFAPEAQQRQPGAGGGGKAKGRKKGRTINLATGQIH